VTFKFVFSPNEYLHSLELTKTFRGVGLPDSNQRITSTAVPIQWKEGKDLTVPTVGVPPSFFSWFAFESEGTGELDAVQIAEQLADEVYPHAHRIWQDALEEESVEDDESLESGGEDPWLRAAVNVDDFEEDEQSEEEPPPKRQKK
jgi:hypothetical protein